MPGLIDSNQASSSKTSTPGLTDVNQVPSGRVSTPTSSKDFLPGFIGHNFHINAKYFRSHCAKPLHQCQPGLIGQSFHTIVNQALLKKVSISMPTKLIGHNFHTNISQGSPNKAFTPGLIEQNFDTSANQASLSKTYIPMLTRPH